MAAEPDAGSAATDMVTAAAPDPEVGGGMILNGQKRWCSGAGHSDMIVFCKMDPEAKEGLEVLAYFCSNNGKSCL